MTTIIDTLKQEAAHEPSKYLEKLRESGFPVPVPGFPKITLSAIREFLEAAAVDIAKTKKTWFSGVGIGKWYRVTKKPWGWDGFELDFSYGFNSESSVCWVERSVEETKAFPPEHVLESIKRARSKFNHIRIVTVEEIPDPLVVGINDGDDTRYLIDWWDKDIDPTKIKTT